MALFTNVPIALFLDGPLGTAPIFDGNTGELAGRMADPRLDVDLGRRRAPLVTVLFGSSIGWARDIIAESDVVVATPSALAHLGAGGSSIVDIVADDDRDAITKARGAIELLVDRRPLDAATRFGDAARPASADAPNDPELLGDPALVIELLVDGRSFVAFGRDPESGLHAGIARVGAWPVIIGATGGTRSAVLTSRDLHRLRRLYRLSGRYNIPLVLTQDCAGYSTEAAHDLEALAALSGAMRDCGSPVISIVTGQGHTLGKFPLGSKQLGAAFIIAWPWAQLATTDTTSYEPAVLDKAREPDPWLAAGRGLVDDVLTPVETAETVRQLVALFSERWQPVARVERPNAVSG
jgi:acetyl-CoA carboxylase carboxyltransferase component